MLISPVRYSFLTNFKPDNGFLIILQPNCDRTHNPVRSKDKENKAIRLLLSTSRQFHPLASLCTHLHRRTQFH